jgi:hypothetical protein
VRADTEITGAGILKEPEDLRPGQFLSGGEAWQAFRAGRLRSPGCLAGTVQATISTGDEPAAEVASVVGTRWQGQGIATEAARALVAWPGQQSVKTVIAHIHPRPSGIRRCRCRGRAHPHRPAARRRNEVAANRDALIESSTGLDNCSRGLWSGSAAVC